MLEISSEGESVMKMWLCTSRKYFQLKHKIINCHFLHPEKGCFSVVT